jgi:hypothetical protein
MDISAGKVTVVMNLGDPRLRFGGMSVDLSDAIDISEPELETTV